MARSMGAGLAIVAVVLALTGCAGSTGSSDGDVLTPTGAATTSTGSGGGGTGGSGETDGGGGGGGDTDDDGVAYVPWGPSDPPIPTEYASLAASSQQPPNCDGAAAAQDGEPFWAFVADVCRAITAGGQWPAGTSIPDPPSTDSPYQVCLNDELTSMLLQALAWHAEHPTGRPSVTYPDTATRSPCQDRIYEVRVLDDPAALPEDSPAGSVPLSVVYAADVSDATVAVDGEAVPTTSGFGDVDFPLLELIAAGPTRSDPRTATIELTTERGILTSTVELPASGASGESTDAESTDSESS